MSTGKPCELGSSLRHLLSCNSYLSSTLLSMKRMKRVDLISVISSFRVLPYRALYTALWE